MKKFFNLQGFQDINNSKSNKILNGTSGDDSFHNDGSLVTIQAGKGNDVVENSGSFVKIYGGAGNDIFVYSAGDDVITGYRVKADKIKLKNTEITDMRVGEENILFTTSKGTVKILHGAGKSITIIDSSGTETNQRYSANISEILADNSIGEFENYNEKVTQENLLTFAK